MKRVTLKGRVELMSALRGELLVAAKAADDALSSGIAWRIRDASTALELAALEYGKASIRYLGGEK